MKPIPWTLALAFAASAVWADDCAQCTEKALCAVHLDMEKSALEEFKKAIKDKDPEKRLAAVEALAGTNKPHANVPSKAVAQAVAGALKDRVYEVRAGTARLLGTQEPAVAVKALGAELDAVLKKIEKVDLKKARGTPEYDQDLKYVGVLYEALKVTKSKDAAPWFVRGIEFKNNGEVVEAAVSRCTHLRIRSVIGAMVGSLVRIAGMNSTPEGNTSWTSINAQMVKATGHDKIKPQVDGNDAGRFARDWETWWRANQDKKEYD